MKNNDEKKYVVVANLFHLFLFNKRLMLFLLPLLFLLENRLEKWRLVGVSLDFASSLYPSTDYVSI